MHMKPIPLPSRCQYPYLQEAAEQHLIPLQVCRQWRRIALSSPSCWSSLEVYGNYDPSQDRGTSAALQALRHTLDWYLSRSGICPLDLIIRITQPYYHYQVDPVLPSKIPIVGDLLRVYSSRFRAFAEIGIPHFLIAFQSVPRFEILSHLQLEAINENSPPVAWNFPAL